MSLRAVVDRLETRGVPCALIGGAALAVHGVARATLDADLLVSELGVLDASFWRGLEFQGPPQIRRGDVDDPLEGLVRFEDLDGCVDVVVMTPRWISDLLARRAWIDLEGQRVPVVQAADLVLLKLVAGGPQDLLDVRLLLAGIPGLDREVASRTAVVPDDARAAWERLVSGV